MAKISAERVVGIPDGSVDPDRQEVAFTLTRSDGRALTFVAKIGIAEQISSAIARMVVGLREARKAKGLHNSQATAAETVAQVLVEREQWEDRIILRLVSDKGVPYTFAMPKEAASKVGNLLLAKSGVPESPPGRA